jgi:hypothetical protein
MKKIVVSIVVVFIATAFSISAMAESRYKLLRSKNLDRSVAKRTVYHIEIDKILGDEEIKKILEQAVKDLAKKRAVDALAVALYFKGTSYPFAHADWAPNGNWGEADSRKSKSIFKTTISISQQLKPKESSNVEKFGLSLEKRKMIYRVLSQSQIKTRQIATQKYPSDWSKQGDYMFELDEKYEKQICDKYNITDEQKYEILGEGVSHSWPD